MIRTLALALLATCLSMPLALAEKKTTEQYWAETGISIDVMLNQLKTLSGNSCYATIQQFRGCLGAVNTVAAMAEEPLQIVPASLIKDATMGYGPTIKNFGPILLTRQNLEPESEEAFRQVWLKTEARRKKAATAVDEIYTATLKSQIDFEAVFKDVAARAIKDKSKDPLAAATAISAYLVQAVDAHAKITPAASVFDSQNDANQSFFGIGTILQPVDGRIVILDVFEGSPALAAGLKPNDVIDSVDGTAVKGKKVDEVAKLIRGLEGEVVNLSVSRAGEIIPIPVTRSRITLDNVESKVVDDLGSKIGIVRLRNFGDKNACAAIETKIKELHSRKVSGLVFDLRGNPGGLLTQSICISGLFVGPKLVVSVKDLQTDQFKKYVATRPALTDLPVVILIDGGSASASEIVAGAVQDHQRGWVIGERSFGKGTVQAPYQFMNPSILMFRTIERFYQPSGRTNQIVGIIPDLEVAAKPNTTEEERFRLREGDIYSNSLEAVGPAFVQSRPEAVKRISDCMAAGNLATKGYERFQAEGKFADFQLLAAQEVLKCEKSVAKYNGR